jgi:predicted phage-related endonuclease
MSDVMAKRKSGGAEMACRRDYRTELVCERLTGVTQDHYVSPAMDRGNDMEPYARAAYEMAEGVMVEQVGLVLHPTLDFAACSPDGLVGTVGGLEIKNPNTATHLEWMLAGVVPEQHKDQLQWCMACCEREWWEFFSMDDRLPQGLRTFIRRLERDDKRIAEMEYAAIEFNAEIEAQCAALGYPDCTPKAPVFRHRSSETERIGAIDVPIDVMDVLEDERFDLRRVP